MKRLVVMAWSSLMIAIAPPVAHANVPLVRDGVPAAEIVVATNALQVVKLAAQDLQKHIELMSGAVLPIVSAPSPDVKARVYVGTNEFTAKLGFKPAAFSNSGFEIVARDTYVILAGPDKQRTGSAYQGPEGLKRWQELCGAKFGYGRGGEGIGEFNYELKIHTNDDPGTWYAVAELLEQLGVRWYMPYDDGTVIPEKKTITVADQHLKKEAAFARREFCFYNAMRQDPEGVTWGKRLKQGNHTIIVYNHTTDDVFGPKEQQALHPEYLACDADGKPYRGYPDGHGMPRYTNPGFREAAANYMNNMFVAVPELAAISLGPPDGGVKMDARDLDLYGKPTDSVEQKASNYVWDFHVFLARELKKRHPGKFLLYNSGGAMEIPTNIEEFPDNLIVPFAQPYSAYRVLKSTDRAVVEYRRKWHALMKTVHKAPVWDYFLYYWQAEAPRDPVVFTESLQREVQEMLPYSDGKFIEIPPAPVKIGDRDVYRLKTPGLIHLMVYWHNKLFWDPQMDRQAMLEEYYELFFGSARAEMKEFYEFAEQVWTRQESRSVTETTGFLKEADVDRYFEILGRARVRAGTGTVYGRRIALIENEMQSLKSFFPSLKRTGPTFEGYIPPGPVTIDGNLDEYRGVKPIPLRDNRTGELPTNNLTEAVLAMTADKSALIVAVTCYEDRMAHLKADCKLNDTSSLFDDDVVEVYVNTPQRSFFKVAVNPNGVVWDESTDVTIIDRDTLPILWNPGTKAAVKKHDDRWTVEIMIPTADFGTGGPTEAAPWGIQVGRTRFTGGQPEAWSIAPTKGPYRLLNKWGSLYVK